MNNMGKAIRSHNAFCNGLDAIAIRFNRKCHANVYNAMRMNSKQ